MHRAVVVPSLWRWGLYVKIRESQNVTGSKTKLSCKEHVIMGRTHRGATGPAYCKCHWVSDSGVQTPIYPVQLFGWLMTEQETRSLSVPELVAARPPVSPRCSELQRDLLWQGDKRSKRSTPGWPGAQRDYQGSEGRWGIWRRGTVGDGDVWAPGTDESWTVRGGMFGFFCSSSAKRRAAMLGAQVCATGLCSYW